MNYKLSQISWTAVSILHSVGDRPTKLDFCVCALTFKLTFESFWFTFTMWLLKVCHSSSFHLPLEIKFEASYLSRQRRKRRLVTILCWANNVSRWIQSHCFSFWCHWLIIRVFSCQGVNFNTGTAYNWTIRIIPFKNYDWRQGVKMTFFVILIFKTKAHCVSNL